MDARTKNGQRLGLFSYPMPLTVGDASTNYQKDRRPAKEIGKVKEQIAMLNIPEPFIIQPFIAPINETIRTLESLLSELSKQVAIALKENEVQDVMIEELKLSTNNPLNG